MTFVRCSLQIQRPSGGGHSPPRPSGTASAALAVQRFLESPAQLGTFAGLTKLNLIVAEAAELSPGVVTVTSTAPVAFSFGDLALQEVVDLQETVRPGFVPNLTVVEPTTKPVPVMVLAVLDTIVAAVAPKRTAVGLPRLVPSAHKDCIDSVRSAIEGLWVPGPHL